MLNGLTGHVLASVSLVGFRNLDFLKVSFDGTILAVRLSFTHRSANELKAKLNFLSFFSRRATALRLLLRTSLALASRNYPYLRISFLNLVNITSW